MSRDLPIDHDHAIDALLSAWTRQQELRIVHAPLAERAASLDEVSHARRTLHDLRKAA